MPDSNQPGTAKLKAGIVICSRLASSRIPEKPLAKVNGVPLLGHLLARLRGSGIPVALAVPTPDRETYLRHFNPGVAIFNGYDDDPLGRMAFVAGSMDLDVVVRITHDKVFVDPCEIRRFLDIFAGSDLDYLYSSSFVPGSGFEVIRASTLHKAAARFKDVEHVSYAIQAVTDRKTDVDAGFRRCPHRLLIDYPEDLDVLCRVLHANGNDCSLSSALTYLNDNPQVSAINQMPEVTVYTCAYNAERWIHDAMQSVFSQRGFHLFEYVLVDDCSEDETDQEMCRVAEGRKNVRFRRNDKNLGLSSSCNVALSMARGKYIIRLDADDYFSGIDVVADMRSAMDASNFDVLYPDHYLGSIAHVEKGNVHHHAGGAMFATRALNHLKFTDALRGYEGFDLFGRAKAQLRVGYYERPTFFYRQHDGSLSKSDAVERRRIKNEISDRLAGIY